MYFHACSVSVDEDHDCEIAVSVLVPGGSINDSGTIRLPAHQALIVGREIIRMAKSVLDDGERII